jgi:hypothetical protein
VTLKVIDGGPACWLVARELFVRRDGCGSDFNVANIFASRFTLDVSVLFLILRYRVEDSAGKPVVDASPSTCKEFTGRTSCGYSDHIQVNCNKVAGLDFSQRT